MALSSAQTDNFSPIICTDSVYPASYRRKSNNTFTGIGNRRLGASLVALGLFCTSFGIMLFFERNLLRIGNLSLLSGLILLVGFDKVSKFLLKKERILAAIITVFGASLVISGKPRLGILCEVMGFFSAFGDILPYLRTILRNIPIVGDLMKTLERNHRHNVNPGQYNRGADNLF